MFETHKPKEYKQIKILTYTLFILIAWSFFAGLSLIWVIYSEKAETIETVKNEAHMALEKDIQYRRWITNYGGVYVPVSSQIQPNPHLLVPERDIQTHSGKKLTLINPAYMTRQVNEIAKTYRGVQGHITSLKPIRPENEPDNWEVQALKAFETGETEISTVEEIDNERFFRLMRPLKTEKKCLNCHAKQGYKVGDIRGGISVSIPLSPLDDIAQNHAYTYMLTHGLLWFSGTAGIIMGMYLLNLQINQRLSAEKKLRQHERMKGVLEMAGTVCHELGQPMQIVLGTSQMMNSDLQKNNSLNEQVGIINKHVEKMGTITRKLMNITKYKTKNYLNGNIIDIDGIDDET